MNPARFLAFILVILVPVVGRALADRGAGDASETRKFTIDGRTFRVEEQAGDGLSLVERELARRGIETLPSATSLSAVLDPRSVEALHDEPAKKGASNLPRGLESDHAMRLETGTGPVEIAFGRVACGVRDILCRLRASGWECRESDFPGALVHLTKDREASVVLLEKNERRFLAIRRVAR